MQDRNRSQYPKPQDQLDALWQAVYGQATPEQVKQIARVMVPNVLTTSWRSFVSDDHSPYEFSLLLGGSEPEVRLMVEAVPASSSPTLGGTISAGRALGEQLRAFGASLTALDEISDIFLPENPPDAKFALWFGACFTRSGEVSFKAYVNPCLFGAHEAPARVEEALGRLGFLQSWMAVATAFPRRPDLDELRFLSIDLLEGEQARFKVYGFLHEADALQLAHAAASAGGSAAQVIDFCRTVSGGEGVFRAGREPGVALAFVAGESTPRTATVHVPVRAFASDDHVAGERLIEVARQTGIDGSTGVHALRALSQQPAKDTSGALSWIGLRVGGKGSPRLNVYLSPQSVATTPSHDAVAPRPNPSALLDVVQRYERFPITSHPLFTRIAREGLDLGTAYTLLANIQLAIANDFARRLASVVARVDEDDIRSMLTKQLDDELGHGDPTRTHKVLFAKLVAGLEAWRPTTPELLAPGEILRTQSDELYLRRSAYEGFGATLIMECVGKQFDIFLGQQLRKSGAELPATVLEWLTLHEALEVDHVDESIELAAMVPRGWKENLAARGAQELADVVQECLNNLYARCFA